MKSNCNRLLLVALALATSATVSAKHITPDAALARFQQMLTPQSRLKMAAAKPKLAMTKDVDNVSTLYVFNQQSDGYLILSADDAVPALLGYSETGGINPDNMPPALKEWLDGISHDISQVSRSRIKLANDRFVVPENWVDIEPMIKSNWAQDDPYDLLCPLNSQKEHSPAGCAATAIAQIMYYYQWPKQGYGSKTYTPKGASYSLTADFGNTHYDWANMVNNYRYKNVRYNESTGKWSATVVTNTPEEEMAVAELMYQLGVSLDMIYGEDASSAQSDALVYDLKGNRPIVDNFGYDGNVEYFERVNFTDDISWEQTVYNELKANRPVFYCGSTVGIGGHAFVCDGFQRKTIDNFDYSYYHINWGWMGMSDGYYLITILNGDIGTALNPEHQGTGGSASNFAQKQFITVKIQPGFGLYSDVSPSILDADDNIVTNPVAGQTYKFRSQCQTVRGDARDMKTYYLGVELINETTHTSTFVDLEQSAQLYKGKVLGDLEFTWPEGLEDGLYEVKSCFKLSESDTEWTSTAITFGNEPLYVGSFNSGCVIKDGTNYTWPTDVVVPSVTYTRKFYANVWNSWFVPFPITTDELSDNHLRAAVVNAVRQYDDDKDGVFDRTTIELLDIVNGTLRAGTPYFIKSDSEYDGSVNLNTPRTVKAATEIHNVHTETAYAKYDFIGTYSKVPEEEAALKYFIMSSEGKLQPTISYVPGIDWYMTIEEKPSLYDAPPASAPATIDIQVIGEEDQATGIRTIYDQPVFGGTFKASVFDLNGRASKQMQHGINIINGKKYLIK